ncbi:hypothetical protein [Bradyrhizobium roseum]
MTSFSGYVAWSVALLLPIYALVRLIFSHRSGIGRCSGQ